MLPKLNSSFKIRFFIFQAYGLKFLLVIDGRASKFDLKNTVIVLVTGLGLLGLSTMFCDFVLLNYSADRKKVC